MSQDLTNENFMSIFGGNNEGTPNQQVSGTPQNQQITQEEQERRTWQSEASRAKYERDQIARQKAELEAELDRIKSERQVQELAPKKPEAINPDSYDFDDPNAQKKYAMDLANYNKAFNEYLEYQQTQALMPVKQQEAQAMFDSQVYEIGSSYYQQYVQQGLNPDVANELASGFVNRFYYEQRPLTPEEFYKLQVADKLLESVRSGELVQRQAQQQQSLPQIPRTGGSFNPPSQKRSLQDIRNEIKGIR